MLEQIKQLAAGALKLQNKDNMDSTLRAIVQLCDSELLLSSPDFTGELKSYSSFGSSVDVNFGVNHLKNPVVIGDGEEIVKRNDEADKIGTAAVKAAKAKVKK